MRTALTLSAILLVTALLSYVWAKPYGEYRKGQCEWCGKSNVRLAVHHIIPQHIAPELKDNPDNLITLCDPLILRSSGCHYKIGHRGMNWKYDNSGMLKVIIEYMRSETNERK